MKFTALEEYGLRCILRLALKEIQEPERQSVTDATSITIGEIATEEGLTQQYAGKIFRILAKADLVESERGRKGGYRLTRSPEKITVSETLEALGGRMFDGEVCGRYTGDRHLCVHSTDCAIRSLWRGLQEMMDQVLMHTTLSDLIVSEHMMNEKVKNFASVFTPAPFPLGKVNPRAEEKVTYDERKE
jgi:Rrf2 family protein